jgi:hypothetical protein
MRGRLRAVVVGKSYDQESFSRAGHFALNLQAFN